MTTQLSIEALQAADLTARNRLSSLERIGVPWVRPVPARAALAARLQRLLTDNPDIREFSVHQVIESLQTDVTPSALVMFSAAGVFDVPHANTLAGRMITGLGAGLARGRSRVTLPRQLMRRKIPRNSLSILIQGIVSLLNTAGDKLQQRWSWVFHPAMGVAIGVMLFLLGIVSMAPVIGGGIQHAASAFLIGVGLAERDGLAVMIGAIAGMASIAFAVYSVVTGRTLWSRVKAWLISCARRLQLNFLAGMLDRACEGLGDLVNIKWGGLLLLLVTPGEPCFEQLRRAGEIGGRLKQRVQRAAVVAGQYEYAG